MGYNTEFTGVLKFTKEPTASELAMLNTILGEDERDHPHWNVVDPNFCYIDLGLTDDFSGVEWNGSESTYGMDQVVSVVIRLMREFVPDFGLTGILYAQGEDVEDRWELHVSEDVAVVFKKPPTGTKAVCPKCSHNFFLEK